MTTIQPHSRLCLLISALLWFLCQGAQASVGVTVTPPAVSNTFNGTITLQITGLAGGDTVVVQKFLDANTNGVIDAGDLLVQQFTLTDGHAGMVIGGVTNFNVPGDTDATSGQITAKLNLNENDFVQLIVGKFLFEVSSPAGHFTAVTSPFSVTNFPFGQGFTGNVVSNGTSTTLPNASILLFPPLQAGHHGLGQPLAGTVANNAGVYSIQAPPGTYRLFSSRSNYLVDTSVLPVITLSSGAFISTNLSLLPATATVSGRLVDSTNSSVGLPGIFMSASGTNGLAGLGESDTNGYYTLGVQSGPWDISAVSGALLLHGYVSPNNKTTANAGATNFAIEFTKASALFYGSVKDTLGNPMPGVDVNGGDNNGSLYDVDVYTDQNGNYDMGLVGGLGDNDPWSISVNSDSNPTNEVFSQPLFDQNGGTNISVGQAILANFTALSASHQITGNIQADGTNLAEVGVYASATINGVNFNVSEDTDGNGNFSLSVGAGTWNVGVNCNGGSDSLDNLLGAGSYLCPDNTNVVINNNDATANFTVQFPSYDAYVSGVVVDNTGNPVGNMNLFAFLDGGGNTYFQAMTDGNGNYRMGVNAGSYDMELNTDPNTGAPSRGLVSPFLPINVTVGVNINNLTLVAQRVTGSIYGSVTNTSVQSGVAGISLFASATVDGTNYTTGSQSTDSSGLTTLAVCNGNWDVGADCNALTGAGFNCPSDLHVDIVNDSGSANFLVSGGNRALSPVLSQASWFPGHFQVALTGAPNQNYMFESSTTLTNWSLVFTTNSGASASLSLTDPAPTNHFKFYRVVVAP